MKILFLILLSLFSFHSFGQDSIAEIAVGHAELDKDKFVIDDAEASGLSGAQKTLLASFLDILKNDFSFYKHKFNIVDYSKKGQNSFSKPQLESWKEHGISYFVTSKVTSNSDGINADIKVWSILTGKEILAKSYAISKNSLRPSTHKVADEIYRSITGKPSVFLSKIVFISDRGTFGKDSIKELYMMDFDGNRVDRLTHFNSIVLSPSVSPDNSKIMFSLIASHRQVSNGKVKTIKNIDLKLFDLGTKKFSTLSELPGVNSGAIYSAGGDHAFMTLTHKGNADIYEMNLQTGARRSVTKHWSDDVDPSITQDGKLMTFLSNRSGRAHIYTMDPSIAEKDLKRISFVGQFNATPRFSPDGREIVFSSWVDGLFDLYRISSDGSNLARLTKNFGSNEEPVYSPDGEFIVFTSKRVISQKKATQDVYIMNRDGEILGQLTSGFGRCYSPVWTNLSK